VKKRSLRLTGHWGPGGKWLIGWNDVSRRAPFLLEGIRASVNFGNTRFHSMEVGDISQTPCTALLLTFIRSDCGRCQSWETVCLAAQDDCWPS